MAKFVSNLLEDLTNCIFQFGVDGRGLKGVAGISLIVGISDLERSVLVDYLSLTVVELWLADIWLVSLDCYIHGGFELL
jgi:hypothetical protein